MRPQDWPERLAAFVADNQFRPFAWGTWDCAMCAAAWIETLTGSNPFQAPYSDAIGAARYIDSQGGMENAASAVLGPPRGIAASAQRGDIALVSIGGRDCLGVVVGEYVAGPSDLGLLLAPRADIVVAWAI